MLSIARVLHYALFVLSVYKIYFCLLNDLFEPYLEAVAVGHVTGYPRSPLVSTNTGIDLLDRFFGIAIMTMWPVCQGNTMAVSLLALSISGGFIAMFSIIVLQTCQTHSFTHGVTK